MWLFLLIVNKFAYFPLDSPLLFITIYKTCSNIIKSPNVLTIATVAWPGRIFTNREILTIQPLFKIFSLERVKMLSDEVPHTKWDSALHPVRVVKVTWPPWARQLSERGNFLVLEVCTEQNWNKIILVPYAETFKKKILSSLFSKLLERRNLNAGFHSYSIISEPKKKLSSPKLSPCQPVKKHSSEKLWTASLPAGFAFVEVTFFWHYAGAQVSCPGTRIHAPCSSPAASFSQAMATYSIRPV